MAKKFFYVCAGLFLLVAAYALGAKNAGAQTAKASASGVGRHQLFQGTFVAVDGKNNRSDRDPVVFKIDTVSGEVVRYSTGLLTDGTYFELWEATDHRK